MRNCVCVTVDIIEARVVLRCFICIIVIDSRRSLRCFLLGIGLASECPACDPIKGPLSYTKNS